VYGFLDSNQKDLQDSIDFIVKNNIKMKIRETFSLKELSLGHMKFKTKDENGKILIVVNEEDVDEM